MRLFRIRYPAGKPERAGVSPQQLKGVCAYKFRQDDSPDWQIRPEHGNAAHLIDCIDHTCCSGNIGQEPNIIYVKNFMDDTSPYDWQAREGKGLGKERIDR